MLIKLALEHIEELFEKLNNLSDEDKRFFHPHKFDRETLYSLLDKKGDYYYVFQEQGEIIGYCCLRTFNKYEIPTLGCVVFEENRRQGKGETIVIGLLKEAKRKKFKIVKLKVYSDNIKAYNLYIKTGFKKIGTEEDKIWMEKTVE